jgi:hypothetical protein
MSELTATPTAPVVPVVHECPPDGEDIMPCCGRSPFEVPSGQRICADGDLVTCHPTKPS